MKVFLTACFAVSLTLFSLKSNDTISYTWHLNSLTEINGHSVEKMGSPKVVDTEFGPAIEFDGDEDRILVDNNPIGSATEFTVEVFFKPDAGINKTNEPRFIHIMDPNDAVEKRVLIEIRVNSKDEVYVDGFIKTDNDNLPLADPALVHPTNEWMHAAIIYKDKVLSTYVNGALELSGDLDYSSQVVNPTGKTSIGGRMDMRNWYKGLVHTLKVTDKAVDPNNFIYIDSIVNPEPDPEPLQISGIKAVSSHHVYYAKNCDCVILDALPEINSELEYAVVDLMGRTVFEGQQGVSNGSVMIRLENKRLSKGVYMLKYKTGDVVASYKFYKF